MSPVLFVLFRLFGKGVMRLNQLLQPFFKDMRIDLCRRNVGMSEEFLNYAKVGAVGKKMACKGVTHDVR